MDKLDKWAEDRRATLKADLDELDEEIKAAKKSARDGPDGAREAGAAARRPQAGEPSARTRGGPIDEASRAVDAEKDRILDDIAARLEQTTKQKRLFTVRWRLV